ncbi:unnamed protein product [Plutella xylostella]|uniref:(diamondback moth) hypothetical protein n=1 Tax=Plutella xylostella TaxID=51655 RepID=A0A8S4DDR6_PLUXY|nr:unnamed protein product [Plutella xylostella]
MSVCRVHRACAELDLGNGQLTPNNNTPLLAQALSVMNNYQAAAAGFGPPASPHGAGGRAGFPAASSPGPALDVYGSAADSVGYVQAASPSPPASPRSPSAARPSTTPRERVKREKCDYKVFRNVSVAAAAAAAARGAICELQHRG